MNGDFHFLRGVVRVRHYHSAGLVSWLRSVRLILPLVGRPGRQVVLVLDAVLRIGLLTRIHVDVLRLRRQCLIGRAVVDRHRRFLLGAVRVGHFHRHRLVRSIQRGLRNRALDGLALHLIRRGRGLLAVLGFRHRDLIQNILLRCLFPILLLQRAALRRILVCIRGSKGKGISHNRMLCIRAIGHQHDLCPIRDDIYIYIQREVTGLQLIILDCSGSIFLLRVGLRILVIPLELDNYIPCLLTCDLNHLRRVSGIFNQRLGYVAHNRCLFR